MFDQYPDRKVLFNIIITLCVPMLGVASAWFLVFRLNDAGSQSLIDLILFMIDIELNFPRDAGVPLLLSGKQGDLVDYMIWIFTIPVPKVVFGQFIDLNINNNIAYILTGRQPGDMGFTVPLTGNLFASIYSLGWLFFIEPIMAGALTGIAYNTAKRYRNSVLLFAYIMVTASYIYNRAGIGGFAPSIYNAFIWLLLFWTPAFYISSRIWRLLYSKKQN
jgi:hypothetical protein